MAAGIRGKSALVQYTTDSGKKVKIRVPQYILDAGQHGLQPTDGTEVPKPARFSPRVVFWDGVVPPAAEGGKETFIRRAIPFNPGAAIVSGDTRKTHVLDGFTGETTGRRGEKVTFE